MPKLSKDKSTFLHSVVQVNTVSYIFLFINNNFKVKTFMKLTLLQLNERVETERTGTLL